jgi:hypothetical protein
MSHITHIKYLDDDDILWPIHLDRLQQAYAISDQIAFVYTSGLNIESSICTTTACPNLGYKTFTPDLPRYAGAIHSSISWSKQSLGALRMRLDFEQIGLLKAWKILPTSNTSGHEVELFQEWSEKDIAQVLPNDAFLYLELSQYITKQQSILDPVNSVEYLTRKMRGKLARKLYGAEQQDFSEIPSRARGNLNNNQKKLRLTSHNNPQLLAKNKKVITKQQEGVPRSRVGTL